MADRTTMADPPWANYIPMLLLAMADLGTHATFLAANLATSFTSFFRSHGLRSNSSYSQRPLRLRNPTEYHRRGETSKPARAFAPHRVQERALRPIVAQELASVLPASYWPRQLRKFRGNSDLVLVTSLIGATLQPFTARIPVPMGAPIGLARRLSSGFVLLRYQFLWQQHTISSETQLLQRDPILLRSVRFAQTKKKGNQW
jgi:hypothetical protein